jgi:hypothetical protein
MLQFRASKGFKNEFDKKGWRHGGCRLMISVRVSVCAGRRMWGRRGGVHGQITHIQEF